MMGQHDWTADVPVCSSLHVLRRGQTRTSAIRGQTRTSAVQTGGCCAFALLLALWPHVAAAHSGAPLAPHDLWTAWELSPPLLLGLAALGLIYARAVRNLWRAAGRGRGLPAWRAGVFGAGLLLLAAALISPVDALGGVLFSGHMVQHVLLMMAAAPLLALGAPAHLWLWALPLGGRRRAARWWRRQMTLRAAASLLRRPLAAWLLAALAMWLWHIPAWYEAALDQEAVHVLEHLTFLGSAWLLWDVVLHSRRGPLDVAVPILLLFTTALHSGLLGALITFAPSPWYAAYAHTTAAWGLSPLADQQLAGVIMWVPAGMAYLGATLALIGMRLAQSERQDTLDGRAGAGSLLPAKDSG